MKYDIVEKHRREGLVMSARAKMTEVAAVTWGLPELARFFIVRYLVW